MEKLICKKDYNRLRYSTSGIVTSTFVDTIFKEGEAYFMYDNGTTCYIRDSNPNRSYLVSYLIGDVRADAFLKETFITRQENRELKLEKILNI